MFKRLATMALAITLGTLLIADAHAGKKDKNKGKAEAPTIEMTGLKSFDKVFTEFQDIDTKIANAEKAMKVAKRKLNEALELEKGTPLKDGIADLKTKAFNGKTAARIVLVSPIANENIKGVRAADLNNSNIKLSMPPGLRNAPTKHYTVKQKAIVP